MSVESLLSLLPFLIFQVPLALIYCTGVILAVVRWKRHPTVSMLCSIAFVSFLGTVLIHSGQQVWIAISLRREESPADMRIVLTALGVLSSLLTILGWATLLPAIFGWRSARQEQK